jgi:hypothetical protein
MAVKKATTAAEVPGKFIACRSFRHELKFVTDKATRGAMGEVIEFTRITRCGVCKTEVHTTYGMPSYHVTKRRYYYPDMYGVKGGMSVFDARDKYIALRFGGGHG